jgi:nucleoside-diphosphate-sugar epimerase
MRVFVAGATGAIGQSLVPQLVGAGHEVSATTRSAGNVDRLRELGAEPLIVDGLDTSAITDAVLRVEPDAIVHEMTALAGRPDLRHFDRWFETTNQLRTKGTDALLAAAQRVGVTRFVAQSYTGWSNPRTGGLVKTEDDGFDPHPLRAQQKSLAAIRYVEERTSAAPLTGVALRYGNLYGPGASDALVDLIRKRRLPVVGDGAGVWSWVHVDDAAAATVAALEQSSSGVYNVVDDEPAPVSTWLPHWAEVIGAKPPMHVPKWLGRLAAGSVTVQWMTEARGASNEKAKHELRWQPRWPTWRDGFGSVTGNRTAS